MKKVIKSKGMFCNMYLVPYLFVDPNEIKFPTDYQKKFKSFTKADDVLIAYGETMILMQRWNKLYTQKKIKNEQINQILSIRHQLLYDCFITPHQSILFYSPAMNNQFNYIYYLILNSCQELEK